MCSSSQRAASVQALLACELARFVANASRSSRVTLRDGGQHSAHPKHGPRFVVSARRRPRAWGAPGRPHSRPGKNGGAARFLLHSKSNFWTAHGGARAALTAAEVRSERRRRDGPQRIKPPRAGLLAQVLLRPREPQIDSIARSASSRRSERTRPIRRKSFERGVGSHHARIYAAAPRRTRR